MTQSPIPNPQSPDDLKQIVGIGRTTEERLHAAGIITFKQLAEANTKDIQAATNVNVFIIESWKERAKELAARSADSLSASKE